MIRKLHIGNLKLHESTDIEVRGLTILTGMNGMGKSSVIQSLLLLRQSHMMNDLESGLNLKGDLCDAGVSGELACQAADDSSLSIGLEFQAQEPLYYRFEYPENVMETALKGTEKNVTDKERLGGYSLFNDRFQYLSAFRFGPRKSYNRDSSLVGTKRQISKVMGQCEYAVHFLEQYKNTDIPLRELALPNEESCKDSGRDSQDDATLPLDVRLAVQVERWLRKISPNIKIVIEPVGEDFKLRYKFNREGNRITQEIGAMNTGFGITYVLPILVAVLSAERGALIVIENPEAHIHPKGQAVLMELMARAVAGGIQIVIETHSDHIVNGALVALNRKTISPEQLSIYYFSRNENAHTCVAHRLDIAESGHIRRPPEGFFDQMDTDMKILTGF